MSPKKSSRSKPGSFGARACKALRVRYFAHGLASMPPSFAASQWIMARIIATPPWADMKAIRAVYNEAARLTEETGVPHVVDHCVPLNHPRVCGLHVDWNLQPIPKGANGAKSNYWNPDQLDLFAEV